jgi:guanylate kinase
MDIDIQGARQILERFPSAVTVFIRPPSMAELEKRMRARATEDESTIALRLSNAREEMAHQEMYRHILVNDDLNRATQEFIDLLKHYRSK